MKNSRQPYTLEEVQRIFLKQDYQVLSTEYSRRTLPLDCLCPVGHPFKTSLGNFLRGCRCPICAKLNRIGRAKKYKYSFEEVKRYFETFGHTLLSINYLNAKTPLEYLCPAGHYHKKSFDNFIRSKVCLECKGIKEYTFEEVKNIISNIGYILTNNSYENSRTKLYLICSQGHEYTTSLYSILKGCRCPHCSRKFLSGSNSPHWILDRERLEAQQKFIKKLRWTLRRCLKKLNIKKRGTTETILEANLGAIFEEFSHKPNYIQWCADSKTWHIDHIIPIAAFIENGISSPAIINHISNIQIVPANMNLTKSANYDQAAFSSYMETMHRLGLTN